MKRLLFCLVVLVGVAAPCWAAGVKLSIQDGLVTLDAQDVTIRQILAEWARVGDTRIVNSERLAGERVTLKLEGVPERQALDVILRAIPGYMAAPRAASHTSGSVYEAILIMATTTAVAPLPAPNALQRGPLGAGGTQLRQPPPPASFPQADSPPPMDPSEDPAIAAAAAAGLIAVPAPAPRSPGLAPLNLPRTVSLPSPAAPAPVNPWGAPAGTPMPSMSPPEPATPAPPQSGLRPVPPEPDR